MNDFKTYTVSSEEKPAVLALLRTELSKREDIVFAYVFGSFVDPDMPFFRDIDIGIYVLDYKKTDWQKYEIDLPIELGKLLEYRYPLDVNVVNKANFLLMRNIIHGNLLFTKDEDLWADFVVYHGKKNADDGEHLLGLMKEAVFG